MNSISNHEAAQRTREWLSQFPDARCVIVVPVFNAAEEVTSCVAALQADPAYRAPILLLDDGSPDPQIQQLDAYVQSDRRILVIHKQKNEGFVATANLAFDACKPFDVALLNSDVITPPGWLERLQDAAYHRSNVATATPLTNNGTILSVPYRNESREYPINPTLKTVGEVDAKVQRASLRLRPVIPTSIGHCTYYRRTALDVVGLYDPVFSPGYEEEVDWAQRAVRFGFCHVAADDLFVYHKGARSFDAHRAIQANALREEHRRLIAQRYPWYLPWVTEVQNDQTSPLVRALMHASSALLGRKIAVDLTFIDGGTTGYQVVALELAHALATSKAKAGDVHLIVPDRVPLDYLKGVDRVATVVRLTEALKQSQAAGAYDLIFRPFQVHTTSELSRLQQLGRRSVMLLLDLILYGNPSYMTSYVEWKTYRTQLNETLATVDGVVFISDDVADSVQHAGVAPPAERSFTSYLGVRHALHTAGAFSLDPPIKDFRRGALADRPFILMIGANYHHKNRLYALSTFKALLTQTDWDGRLVFAGPHAMLGDSSADEKTKIAFSDVLQQRVVDVGAVTESEKRWLFERARLVLYPSVFEGFGLVPFEAALAGTPAITTRMTSLSEILGEEVIYLESFEPQGGAETIWKLLSDDALRQRQVSAILKRAEDFQWNEIGNELWTFFGRILHMPKRAPAAFMISPARRGAATNTMNKLANDARRRMRGWSRTSRTYGTKAMMSEIWSYVQWRLRQLG